MNTIPINKILLDKITYNYLYNNCIKNIEGSNISRLPIKYDNFNKELDKNKIDNLKKSIIKTKSNKGIAVEKFLDTSFYKIIDNRELLVLSLCNNEPQINAKIINKETKIVSKKSSKIKTAKKTSRKRLKKTSRKRSKKTSRKKSKK